MEIETSEIGDEATETCRRIVLVDDHPIVRDGLVQMFAPQADLTVCGEAGCMDDALKVIEEQKPDLAIVDIFLEGVNGIELTKMLHERDPRLPILVLSMHDEGLYAERAIRAGARGYVMKQEASRTILEAVRCVLDGKRYVSRHVSEILGDHTVDSDESQFESAVGRLSPRELGIFECVGAGKDRSAIAEELRISIKTVETHRASIKYKLNARSAAELQQYATRWVQGEGGRKAEMGKAES
ncbi:MAG: response regulator transcription factor [Verrucomicrobia bacterium]|nr:response regulator transcription factor [Verrucomicrobiota bacterium]